MKTILLKNNDEKNALCMQITTLYFNYCGGRNISACKSHSLQVQNTVGG